MLIRVIVASVWYVRNIQKKPLAMQEAIKIILMILVFYGFPVLGDIVKLFALERDTVMS